MSFHPAVTDTLGSFHLMRHFLEIWRKKLKETDEHEVPLPHEDQQQLLSIERILQDEGNCSPSLKGLLERGWGGLTDYVMPHKSPMDKTQPVYGDADTLVLRGFLKVEETKRLLARIDEDECSLHGVLLAAGLIALSRTLNRDEATEPLTTFNVSNVFNLRPYCSTYVPRHGNLTGYHQQDYQVPFGIDDAAEFWKFAHDLNVKLQSIRSKNPTELLKHFTETCRIKSELCVACYGDLDRVFQEGNQDIQLEDVFHCQAAPTLGIPFYHSAHILHGKLNYILAYNTAYVQDQSMAFMVRDETIHILRMAVE